MRQNHGPLHPIQRDKTSLISTNLVQSNCAFTFSASRFANTIVYYQEVQVVHKWKGLPSGPRSTVIMNEQRRELVCANRKKVSLFALTQIYPVEFVNSDNGKCRLAVSENWAKYPTLSAIGRGCESKINYPGGSHDVHIILWLFLTLPPLGQQNIYYLSTNLFHPPLPLRCGRHILKPPDRRTMNRLLPPKMQCSKFALPLWRPFCAASEQ